MSENKAFVYSGGYIELLLDDRGKVMNCMPNLLSLDKYFKAVFKVSFKDFYRTEASVLILKIPFFDILKFDCFLGIEDKEVSMRDFLIGKYGEEAASLVEFICK